MRAILGARGGHGNGPAADVRRKLNVSRRIKVLKNGVSVSSSSRCEAVRCGAVRYRLAHSYYSQPYTYLLAYLPTCLPTNEATCAAGECDFFMACTLVGGKGNSSRGHARSCSAEVTSSDRDGIKSAPVLRV